MKIIKRIVILSLIILVIAFNTQAFADVGSFEDYDSGSSWDSGSSYDWDSGSSSSWDSGSSSDWDYDSDYRGAPSMPIILLNGIGLLIYIFILYFILQKFRKHLNRPRMNYENIRSQTIYEDNLVANKIKQIDPNFNVEEFESYAKEIFIKLQNAWTDRDWEKIRPFESKELFEQHKAQLDGYIKNNQINVMERICVNWVHLLTFEQYAGNDILKVDLNSRMGDYIIDATTKKVIRGDKNKEYYHTYTLTFIRTTGELTEAGANGLKTTNCPNCGAPTTITSSGRCEYCNSVITTERYGWVLSNLTRKN